MTNISLNTIYNYNVKIFKDSIDKKSLLDLLNHNKRDILLTIRDFLRTKETISININEIRKNLKKKSKKYIVTKDNNEGNLYSLGADIELQQDSYRLIMLPLGEYIENYNAKMTFKTFNINKNRLIKNKYNQLIVALRSNKVKFDYTYTKDTLKLEVNDPRTNEKFWNTILFWSKH